MSFSRIQIGRNQCRIGKFIGIFISLAIFLGSGIPAAFAVLERTGPVSATNGYPAWYQDKTGLTLEFASPLNQLELDGGWCLLLPADVPGGEAPEVFPTVFSDEHFYWAGDALIDFDEGDITDGQARLVLGLEAAFGVGPVVPGQQVTFGRVRIRVDDAPYDGDYTVYTPFGKYVLEDQIAGERIFFTEDLGLGAMGTFDGALNGKLGPFLLPSNVPGGAELPAVSGPVPGKLYIASPARVGAVTGSSLPPFRSVVDNQLYNHNIFRIEGPNGFVIQTTNFSLVGRIFQGPMDGRVVIDRANYALTSETKKLDVFATGNPTTQGRLPGAPIPPQIMPVLSFYNAPPTINPITGALSAPTGVAEIPMFSSGKSYWGQIIPANLPLSITVKDSNARNGAGQVISTFFQKNVTDQIFISRASYDPAIGRLSVRARSSDEVNSLGLTVQGFGPLANGTYTTDTLAAPPNKVHLLSTKGGTNEAEVSTTMVPDAPSAVAAVAGNTTASVSFAVPASDGGSPITHYTVTSNPGGITATGTASPIIVAGLTNGTPYTFTVVATNLMGDSLPSAPSNSVTPGAAPGAPTAVNASAGNTTATVSFIPPIPDGGFPITLYTVTSNPGNITATGSASPIMVTGLTNGTSYNFQVAATNEFGIGLVSDPSNSVTPATLPGAPIIDTAFPGDTAASVFFAPPVSDGGMPITLYTVTSDPGGIVKTGTASPITVANLTNGTSYTLTVTATNAIGTGPASSVSNSVIPAIVPDSPVIGHASAGNTTASVAFTRIVANSTTANTIYTVKSDPGGLTATGTDSPILVTGLTNGTIYTFTVTASNEEGVSLPSAPSNNVLPSTKPGLPTSVTAEAGNAAAVISFDQPVSNGGMPILLYTVTANPGGNTATGAASPITVTGLTNGTAYTFTVSAENALGSGLQSTPSNSVTPAAVPGSPTAASAVPGNEQAIVSFLEPASDGGHPISFYTVTSSPGGITASGAVSPITVSGLTNGTAYTFMVTATNTIGESLSSAASNMVTPVTVPGAPTGITATAGNTFATVAFTPPASNGGSAIALYTVTANPGGRTGTGSVSPIVVTGLANGTAYTFTVKATNVVGEGLSSVPSSSVTPVTIPGVPAAVSAVAGNTTASVAFTPPASNGGSAITLYTVTSNPGNITATGDASPIAVTGLTNGTAYTFTVKATNAIGTGPASSFSNSVTPITLPGTPIIGLATPGNTTANISFGAPTSSGGSAITLYTVTASPGGRTGTGTASPIAVTGLTNGTAYTFTVRATNAAGTGLASGASNSIIPATTPGTPTAISATAGDALANVAFTAPASNGGSAITLYTVTANPGGRTGTGTASPIAVTGLTNGTAYTFTVAAANAVGTGLPSAASNSVTPVTLPGAPTAVSATAGNTTASVTFTAPASNGGSAITLYTVTASPGGATATGPSSPILVTGLTNGTAYTFTVIANSAAGASLPSAASNVVMPVTTPGAPTAINATAGNTLANVAFAAPASNGGSAITLYTVTANPGGRTATGTASPIAVTGLTNGTAYTFTARATNIAGAGPASISSNSVTPVTLPGAPIAVSATAGNTLANVAFTAPASNGGSAITLYTVTASPGGRTGTGVASPIAVTGLTNGTAYTFTVTAANAVGTGLPSAASNSITPATLPGAPTAVSATAGNVLANVAFTAPASNGGSAITLYTATANPGGRTGTGVASPIAVTGLTNGTAYTFTVRATNVVGTGPASSPSIAVTPITVPGAPIIGQATAGNALANVAFTVPASNGGSAITLYTMTASPSGRTGTGTASPIAVTGLTNGTAYTFTVRATNAAGAGLPSAPSNSVIPATVPGAPVIGFATAGNTTANVTFTPPATNGGRAITLYTVTANPDGRTATGTASPITVTGLTNGTIYRFTVRATNTIGTGPASASSNGVTPTASVGTIPLAPSSVAAIPSALSINPPTIRVNWVDNSSIERGFTIQRATDPSFTIGLRIFTVGTDVRTFTDTTPLLRTLYYYRVVATSIVGPSAFSNVASATTAGQLPGTPTNLVFVSATANSVSLTATDNATNESGFYIERSTAGTSGPWTRRVTLPAQTNPVTSPVSGIDPGLSSNTNYWYRLQAFNSDGVSSFSNIVAATTRP